MTLLGKRLAHSCLKELPEEIYNLIFMLGGAEGAKNFWGLSNRFSTNPEKIVKVRKSAPSKIGFL